MSVSGTNISYGHRATVIPLLALRDLAITYVLVPTALPPDTATVPS